jgi:hypothetical protein
MRPFRITFGYQQAVDLAEQSGFGLSHPVEQWVLPLVMLRERGGQVVHVEPLVLRVIS